MAAATQVQIPPASGSPVNIANLLLNYMASRGGRAVIEGVENIGAIKLLLLLEHIVAIGEVRPLAVGGTLFTLTAQGWRAVLKVVEASLSSEERRSLTSIYYAAAAKVTSPNIPYAIQASLRSRELVTTAGGDAVHTPLGRRLTAYILGEPYAGPQLSAADQQEEDEEQYIRWPLGKTHLPRQVVLLLLIRGGDDLSGTAHRVALEDLRAAGCVREVPNGQPTLTERGENILALHLGEWLSDDEHLTLDGVFHKRWVLPALYTDQSIINSLIRRGLLTPGSSVTSGTVTGLGSRIAQILYSDFNPEQKRTPRQAPEAEPQPTTKAAHDNLYRTTLQRSSSRAALRHIARQAVLGKPARAPCTTPAKDKHQKEPQRDSDKPAEEGWMDKWLRIPKPAREAAIRKKTSSKKRWIREWQALSEEEKTRRKIAWFGSADPEFLRPAPIVEPDKGEASDPWLKSRPIDSVEIEQFREEAIATSLQGFAPETYVLPTSCAAQIDEALAREATKQQRQKEQRYWLGRRRRRYGLVGVDDHTILKSAVFSDGNVMALPDRTEPIEIEGETRTIAQWSRDPLCAVSEFTLRYRLARGVEPREALITGQRAAAYAPGDEDKPWELRTAQCTYRETMERRSRYPWGGEWWAAEELATELRAVVPVNVVRQRLRSG